MATPPKPVIGHVVRCDVLWPEGASGRRVHGKDRPACVLIVLEGPTLGMTEVVVAPITHSPPAADRAAIEIPTDETRRHGLDDCPSWIVRDTLNRQAWPDSLLPIGRGGDKLASGRMSLPMLRQIREIVAKAARERRIRIVPRP